MSSEFDPSPRSSKRRKTSRYSGQRTTLPDDLPHVVNIDKTTSEDVQPKSVTPKARQTEKKVTNGTQGVQSVGHGDRQSDDLTIEVDEPDQNGTPSKTSKRSSEPHNFPPSILESNGTHDDHRNNVEGAISAQELDGQKSGLAEEDTPKIRSSGRQRKKPERFASTTDDIPSIAPTIMPTLQLESSLKIIASPVIKGILTPSRKQKAPRPRKSVMFDQDEAAIGEQFGFKDIDTPAKIQSKESFKKRTPRRTAVKARESVVEEQDVDIEVHHEEVETFDDMVIDDHQMDVAIPELLSAEDIPGLSSSADNPSIQRIKSNVLARLTSASLPSRPPPHLDSPYTQLHTLLKSTIVSSESNSLLLLGPRGAGKSMLLSLALRSLANEYSSDFHTVHLDGFLQTDDRLALREIWRQLGREMQVDELETEDVAGSYADTMASLLSLLSHPDEMTVDDQTDADNEQRTSKSIVFILDEFDLFTNHPRQTLLYNLFDIAQSRKAPIVVVGCSTRMDVIECLEKRVKSRFSHRWLLVSSCKTLLEWEGLVKESLLAEDREKLLSKPSKEAAWRETWNKYIETTLLPSKPIQTLLKSRFYTTKSLPDLFTALYPIIATLTLPPSPTPIRSQIPISPPDILSLLPTLPPLHTTLLISTSRLQTIHHLPSINFNLIHTHYTELIAQSRLRHAANGNLAGPGSLRAWSRETCRGAWEELGRWGVITPVVGGREDGDGDGGDGWETKMWRGEVTLEALRWGLIGVERGDGSGILEKWCREV